MIGFLEAWLGWFKIVITRKLLLLYGEGARSSLLGFKEMRYILKVTVRNIGVHGEVLVCLCGLMWAFISSTCKGMNGIDQAWLSWIDTEK